MSMRGNLHTHTTFCDGADAIEELVQAAVDQKLTAIGFSGHAHTAHDERYCMSVAGTQKYQEEIAVLRKRYEGAIKVFCGLEMDYFSDTDPKDFDYIIGSVHYVEKNGVYYDVDESPEKLFETVNAAWDGDYIAFAEDYFRLVGDIVRKTHADIIGHFDLVSKFNEGGKLFDENDPRYVSAWRKALDKLLPTGKPFEINTGAMARGYRTEPYPSRAILTEIASRGGSVIITSDCHQKDALAFGFAEAEAYATSCGIQKIYNFLPSES